jgi:RNA polymerase sigma-70 factor (ECF subfamily)
MMQDDLDSWVRLSQNGDMEAFGQVVKRLHGQVRGHAALLGVDSDSIDDVAQEVFVEVFRSLRRYDAGRSFQEWVRGFTRNVVLRHSERRSREYKLRKDALSAYLREKEVQAPESPAEGSALEGLHRCLDRLPEHLRTLVLLRYAEGKKSGAIAAELRRSADAVRMALMRTRDVLLRCMEAQGSGDPA